MYVCTYWRCARRSDIYIYIYIYICVYSQCLAHDVILHKLGRAGTLCMAHGMTHTFVTAYMLLYLFRLDNLDLMRRHATTYRLHGTWCMSAYYSPSLSLSLSLTPPSLPHSLYVYIYIYMYTCTCIYVYVNFSTNV